MLQIHKDQYVSCFQKLSKIEVPRDVTLCYNEGTYVVIYDIYIPVFYFVVDNSTTMMVQCLK